MLTFKKVRKYFDSNLVLDIPDLDLDNNIYWVKGENGSGKSTLLRMVAGLLPFDGDISFMKIGLRHKPVLYRRCVAWADADPLFPAFMTGRELMEFYRAIRSTPSTQIDTLIAGFAMQQYIDLKTGTYSTGTLKKLSLMLAFLGNPQLILLDEPLITLDNTSVECVYELVRERQKAGSLLLISSHEEHDPLVLSSGKRLLVSNYTVQLT